jgi:hypothetical protein
VKHLKLRSRSEDIDIACLSGLASREVYAEIIVAQAERGNAGQCGTATVCCGEVQLLGVPDHRQITGPHQAMAAR